MRYVAFLRAINVGGHTVKMDQLRRIFEAMGFGNVSTFIASGNVIFESGSKDIARLEKKIERQLKHTLGYDVATFVRAPVELTRIALTKTDGGATLYVGFMKQKPGIAAKRKVASLSNETDSFELKGHELYWHAKKGLGDATVSGALLEKTLNTPITFRNINTVQRLAAHGPKSA